VSAERRLVLMRHAKSSWDGDTGDDHARSLNDRGRREAMRIAERLVEAGWAPERVVASDAVRTLETWARMVGRMPPGIEVLQTPRLYHAGIEPFCAVVGEQPDRIRTLLVLGHNPGWEEVARRLTGLPIGLSTSTAVLLAHDGGSSWGEVVQDAHGCTVVDILRPG
jgi:phosphohistidine phosphatase